MPEKPGEITRELSFSEAIREAMVEEMRRDPSVFLIGEDVGAFGGVWGVSAGMVEEFGEERVRDTPISEIAIVGAGLGAAMMGMRPIAEIMFGDFLMCAGDQIVNQVAKARFMSGGKANVPLTIRVTSGAPGSAAAQHSQSPESWFHERAGPQDSPCPLHPPMPRACSSQLFGARIRCSFLSTRCFTLNEDLCPRIRNSWSLWTSLGAARGQRS